MAKESYYFPHDYDAANDFKISALIGKHGAAGYGIFWRIVEMLHSEDEHRLPLKDYLYAAIAKQMSANVEQVKAIVDECISEFEIFSSDGKSFWSNRVVRNIDKREEISEKRRRAGLKRAANAKQVQASAEQMEANDEQNPTKEKKGNEIKGNSKYTLEYFEQQGYEFNLPKIGHDAINRFLEWREKHPSHGAIKSPQQVEAIIIGFRNKNYTAEQVVASVNKTIANGAKNLIMDEVASKPTAKTTIPKPHPDLPDDWWTSTKLTREQILLIPSSINAARITAQNRAKGSNLGI